MDSKVKLILNKKLAEWAGLKWKLGDLGGFADEYGYLQPYFTQSLDACFKWLVPKLGKYPCIKFDFEDGLVFAYVCADDDKNAYGSAETAALALCLAIERLIDNG